MHNILKQFVKIVIKLIVRNEQVMKRKWQNSSLLEVTAPVLKICFGPPPPTADFWSVWSSQKARKF